MFKIALAGFQVENRLEKTCLFQETFSLTDISIEVVLRMFFLIFNNINI